MAKSQSLSPLSPIYQERFAGTINTMCSPKNIKKTAKLFQQLEQTYGPYEFGKFAKRMVPDQGDWGSAAAFRLWERTVKEIPTQFRQRITQILGANFRSANPLPLLLRVGTNIDESHEMIVKTFAANDTVYIGVLMLCPDVEPPPQGSRPKAG